MNDQVKTENNCASCLGLGLAFSAWICGVGVALLCHYMDYGWNPGAKTWAKYSLVFTTLGAGFATLYFLVALARLDVRERDAETLEATR